MKLSIITINFNDHEGLDKTIQSVINQTYKDFEYIVIDGASTDGSVDVIKKYADRLTHWVSEPDTGIYNAMNKGTRLAQGEYCLYLNSGDFLATENVLDELFENSFSEDIVSCTCLNFDEHNKILEIPPKQLSLFTFVGGSLPHPTSLIKRDLINRLGGYNESFRIISDWCFFLDAAIVYNCSYKTCDIVLAYFNRWGISTTSSKLEQKEAEEYLKMRFPRVMNDYVVFRDEAFYNVLQWLQSYKHLKNIVAFPFKVLNRILHLRNSLGCKVGIKEMK